MRLTHLAIVLGLFGVTACGKKQQTPEASKPVPAATTPSDPQPEAAGAAAPAPAPATTAAPAAPGGSRGPVKKGGDPQDGGE